MDNFKYYQPNKKDIKDKSGDCAVRCICKAENIEWLEAYDIMSQYAREVQSPFNVKMGFEHVVTRLGYKYKGISNRAGSKRPTVNEFAEKHKKGTYICVIANHYVTIQDGKYYDIWDSGKKSMYGYWTKEAIT